MTLDDTLREAASRGLTGLTLWPTQDGRWQANARRAGSTGWRVEFAADPADALRLVLSEKTTDTTPQPQAEDDIFG